MWDIARKRSVWALVLALLLLSGCSSGSRAPVIERGLYADQKPAVYHVVSGDTLYSIAWRYGLDFREVASWNTIKSPYTIYQGQPLRLTPPPVISKVASVTVSPSAAAPPAPRPVAPPRAAASVPAKPVPPPAPVSAPVPRVTPTVKLTDSDSGSSESAEKEWYWPVPGHVLSKFRNQNPSHKGIDLAGRLGESVHAARAGKVVYAGSGLVGYGQLIIIRHDDTFLSAYAHNSQLLVKEGEMVKSRQKIALMGDSGTDSVKLHFEIRREGKPIDPLKILPRRR